jgi:hypothetical protein
MPARSQRCFASLPIIALLVAPSPACFEAAPPRPRVPSLAEAPSDETEDGPTTFDPTTTGFDPTTSGAVDDDDVSTTTGLPASGGSSSTGAIATETDESSGAPATTSSPAGTDASSSASSVSLGEDSGSLDPLGGCAPDTCGGPSEDLLCFCDSLCIENDDCCPDYLQVCLY